MGPTGFFEELHPFHETATRTRLPRQHAHEREKVVFKQRKLTADAGRPTRNASPSTRRGERRSSPYRASIKCAPCTQLWRRTPDGGRHPRGQTGLSGHPCPRHQRQRPHHARLRARRWVSPSSPPTLTTTQRGTPHPQVTAGGGDCTPRICLAGEHPAAPPLI